MPFSVASNLRLLPLICACLCPSVMQAQLPRSLERCLPYPTLAEEIEDMREDVRAKMNASASRLDREPTGSIEAIQFDGQIHLPGMVLDELIAELKQHEFKSGSEWLDEIQEVPIKGAWQNNGYFRVKTTAESQMVHGDFTHLYFSVTVHVNEGLQYRIGDISFSKPPDSGDTKVFFSGEGSRLSGPSNVGELGLASSTEPGHTSAARSGETLPKRVPLSGFVTELTGPAVASVFPVEVLRKLLSLQEGDILSASKVRDGLEAMKKFYDKNGYVDFVAIPFMEIDDERQVVSLRFELDEGKQLRVGKIEVFGLGASAENALIWKIKPGDIFSHQLLESFFKANQSLLPDWVSVQNAELYVNPRAGTVDIRFEFQSCPQE
jgi:hypothetical protein